MYKKQHLYVSPFFWHASMRVRTVKQELSSVLKNLNGDGSGLSDDECGQLLSCNRSVSNASTRSTGKALKNKLENKQSLFTLKSEVC